MVLVKTSFTYRRTPHVIETTSSSSLSPIFLSPTEAGRRGAPRRCVWPCCAHAGAGSHARARAGVEPHQSGLARAAGSRTRRGAPPAARTHRGPRVRRSQPASGRARAGGGAPGVAAEHRRWLRGSASPAELRARGGQVWWAGREKRKEKTNRTT